MRPLAPRFKEFAGGRDLFAALSLCAAQGLDGDELIRAVNERLAQDEQEQGVILDRLSGVWLKLWEQAIRTYDEVWPTIQPELEHIAAGLTGCLEPVLPRVAREMALIARSRSRALPSRITIAMVERGLGMHRASDAVIVLEAYPPDQLWPYVVTHELFHAVTPHCSESAFHQIAGEMLTDLAAAHLGAALSRASDPLLERDLETRWEGWKLSYGVETAVSGADAHAQALIVWRDLLEQQGYFEDAVDRLAMVLWQSEDSSGGNESAGLRAPKARVP